MTECGSGDGYRRFESGRCLHIQDTRTVYFLTLSTMTTLQHYTTYPSWSGSDHQDKQNSTSGEGQTSIHCNRGSRHASPLSRLWGRNTLHLSVIEPLLLSCSPHRLVTTMTELSGFRTTYDAGVKPGPVISDTSVSRAYIRSWLYLATPHSPRDIVARSAHVWYWILNLISLASWEHRQVLGFSGDG
jgi:hypothetical protein